ncbi:hypothetical protein niasHT_027164 [Heterodera trifolii]|uniref:polynucleotide adenylyltransferase n=1 Tax=Heterodera trifolii TaxID=157864 RepID=A0ABD2KSY4_9BILA
MDSDVDTICVSPEHIHADQFFGTVSCHLKFAEECRNDGLLFCRLCFLSEIHSLQRIQSNWVPLIRIKVINFEHEIDIVFASIPGENQIHFNDDDNYDNDAHYIYNNALGFFNGTSLAILAAKIMLLYPDATIPFLLERFFLTYATCFYYFLLIQLVVTKWLGAVPSMRPWWGGEAAGKLFAVGVAFWLLQEAAAGRLGPIVNGEPPDCPPPCPPPCQPPKPEQKEENKAAEEEGMPTWAWVCIVGAVLVVVVAAGQSVLIATKMNRRWICSDVWMDILPSFDRFQHGLKMALLSYRFDALVDTHFDGKMTELTIWRSIEICKDEEPKANDIGPKPPKISVRIDAGKLYIDHSVIKFLRSNKHIWDRSGTNLELTEIDDEQPIWDVLAHEIWPIFATSIRCLSFGDAEHFDALCRCISPTLLTDLDQLISIDFAHHLFLDRMTDFDWPNATSAGQVLSEWLHTFEETFIRATDSVSFQIRFGVFEPLPIEPFELVNKRTNEKLTLIKEDDTYWLLKRRCPTVGTGRRLCVRSPPEPVLRTGDRALARRPPCSTWPTCCVSLYMWSTSARNRNSATSLAAAAGLLAFSLLRGSADDSSLAPLVNGEPTDCQPPKRQQEKVKAAEEGMPTWGWVCIVGAVLVVVVAAGVLAAVCLFAVGVAFWLLQEAAAGRLGPIVNGEPPDCPPPCPPPCQPPKPEQKEEMKAAEEEGMPTWACVLIGTVCVVVVAAIATTAICLKWRQTERSANAVGVFDSAPGTSFSNIKSVFVGDPGANDPDMSLENKIEARK